MGIEEVSVSPVLIIILCEQSQADALAAGIENLVLVATDSTGAF